LDHAISRDAQVFKSRLIFAANAVGGFWLGIGGYFGILAFLIWDGSQNDQLFLLNKFFFVLLLANGIVGVVLLFPGRLLAMWPYTIVLEPQKGIWVYAPPTKLWIPLEEITDIDIYSGWYGGGHVIQLNRSYGLVKQLYIPSLFFPDEQLARAIRISIDRRDGVVHAS
jgi:hypothetical protein